MHARPDLDLRHYHVRREYGDILLFATWFGQDRRPALVLIPTAREGKDGVTPCVVPLASAYLWCADLAIGDIEHVVRNSKMFAQNLGFTPSLALCRRITLIVQDALGDLLTIPPKPIERYVAADAIRTDADGREHYSEVHDHV